MRNLQGNVVQGRTRWRRFAALLLPTLALTGGVLFGMANGAVAATFVVSGQDFKVSADKLVGSGFVQYGGLKEGPLGANGKPTQHPVAISGMATADLYNLCQSVRVPKLPVPVVLTIRAGQEAGKPAKATGLLLDVKRLEGEASFKNMQIGRNAGELGGQPGGFGQSADEVTITDLKQIALSTTAGTFTLTGLKLNVNVGDKAQECFTFPDETP